MDEGELTLTKDDSRPADLRVMPSSELSNIATGTGVERGETGFSLVPSAMLGRLVLMDTDFFDCGCGSSFEKIRVTVVPTSGLSHTGGPPLLVSDGTLEALELFSEDVWQMSFRNSSALARDPSLLNLRLPALFLFELNSKSAILVFSMARSAFQSLRSFSNISLSRTELSL